MEPSHHAHPSPYTGKLAVKGPKAKSLLQGQLTCDLDHVSQTKSTLGAQCNRSGKIISLFQLSGEAEHYELRMPRDLVPLAKRVLDKYAALYRGGVTLLDLSDTVTDCGSALEDIRKGLPALYPETSEKFFAHELNLPALGAISFDKGCYTGQEIIARMHYRGKPKTELLHVHVKTTQPPVRGSDIYHAAGTCGTLVDFAESRPGIYELLVIASLSHQDPLFMDEAHTFPLERD